MLGKRGVYEEKGVHSCDMSFAMRSGMLGGLFSIFGCTSA